VPPPLGPPPAIVDDHRVVTPDVHRIEARLTLDAAGREGVGEARLEFEAGEADGRQALDLRQPVEWVRLDGKPIDVDDLLAVDLGAGPGTEMRVLQPVLERGTPHVLEIGYRLGTPEAIGAEPIGWSGGGVRFDLWMSDLHPGRYLEMWVPAPLIHDRFALELTVELIGQNRAHTVVSNAERMDVDAPAGRWTLHYPEHFTALSPMLVMAPTDEVELRRTRAAVAGRDRPLDVITARTVEVDADLAACEADVVAWLSYLSARYGPWVHGEAYTAFVWGPGRGMEYDGATTASVGALEHEVFHSWFGRGLKPARAADGWIDEAYTSWATGSRRLDLPRFASLELGLDEPPVELYPSHSWSRHTAVEAYTAGARLFAGLANRLGGPGRLRSAMAEWYRINAGRLVTTDGLAAHLEAWSGVDINPWWARYVHGRG
jgi:hypothetical protein